MKRIFKSKIFTEIPPVQLFIDDVQFILDYLYKDIPVELTHHDYTYESIDELKSNIKRDSIDSLYISASNRSDIRIDINQGHVEIQNFGGNKNEERILCITERLRQNVRWYSWRPMGRWWTGFTGFLSFWLLFAGSFFIYIYNNLSRSFPDPSIPPLHFPTESIYLTLSLLDIFLVCHIFLQSNSRVLIGGSKIYLHTQMEKPTFWQRNSDQIFLSAIFTIIGIAIGIFIEKVRTIF